MRPFQGKTGQSQNSYRSDIQSMSCVIFACTWWILLSGMAARTSWRTWVRHRRSSPPTLKQEMPRPSSVVSSKLGTQHTLNHQFTLQIRSNKNEDNRLRNGVASCVDSIQNSYHIVTMETALFVYLSNL